jgi:anti-sigma B factor antagonist
MDNLTVTLSNSPLNRDVTLLTVKGSMDTNTISEFDKNFQSALMNKHFKLVVDLKDVYYISSAGWGVFVSEIKRIRHENGDLVLAGMSPDVMDVFDLLQFGTILKFFPDVESAVKKGFDGLPPGAAKTAARLSGKRVKKADFRVAPFGLIGETGQMANPGAEPKPAAAPEPAIMEVRVPYWRRVLLDWRFWAVVLLGALGVYVISRELAG